MFSSVRSCISQALQQTSNGEVVVSPNDILLEQPKDEALGDIYTNAAMAFSKKLKMPPKALAETICESLRKNEVVTTAEVANPGFINIRLKNSAWQNVVADIIQNAKTYGYSNLYDGKAVNVEFVSANPTGPLHTGHARNAVFGSVVANLLERVGYKVTREFYINDQGNQIRSLACSLYLRYEEALGRAISDADFTSDMYCGAYVKDLAKELVKQCGDKFLDKAESDWLGFFRTFAIDHMMEDVKKDLASIGVVMDVYTSEAGLCKRNLVDDALQILQKHGDIYEGVLPRPKGISADDEWEERPQTLFRSTKYGDDVDRAIKKSDGTWTYFAGDLAYHLDKFRRGYTKMVAVLGADHNGYVKRLKSAVSALSGGKAEIDIKLYQLVNFLENGTPVRMSKRAGNFITLHDVVERVGKDVARYMMISRHHDVMIDFDFVKAVEHSMDNPLFYIQYAYARICSVFRHFETENGKLDEKELATCDKSSLSDSAELSLIKALAFWTERVKAAALAIEPHRIPTCLQNIAALFHSLWNKGKTNTELRFIDKTNKRDTLARLSLLLATKRIIEDGFDIIGITPMSEMR
ncbi:MAG: arginine--tRNA ligase [Alphaproteobacteria bacterium]|nr:arginine--tRNA ligase [Alphaproteobacteria bacterium]